MISSEFIPSMIRLISPVISAGGMSSRVAINIWRVTRLIESLVRVIFDHLMTTDVGCTAVAGVVFCRGSGYVTACVSFPSKEIEGQRGVW